MNEHGPEGPRRPMWLSTKLDMLVTKMDSLAGRLGIGRKTPSSPPSIPDSFESWTDPRQVPVIPPPQKLIMVLKNQYLIQTLKKSVRQF
ncbi:hypothetical protein HY025_01845 [Candidatus Daviesbacteria bacterium]|nr:hypothetical protein [Candidatus Daviesbacteria bacterium]